MITVERSKLGELFSGNLQQLKMARGNERLARLVVTNHVLYDTAAATFVSTLQLERAEILSILRGINNAIPSGSLAYSSSGAEVQKR